MATGGHHISMDIITEEMVPGTRRERAKSLFKDKHTNLLDEFDECIRPRTSSMPVRSEIKRPNLSHIHRRHHERLQWNQCADHEQNTYTVRMFEVNSKGVIKSRTDTMRSRSTNSMSSDGGGDMYLHLSQLSLDSSSSKDSFGTQKSTGQCNVSHVIVMGSEGVGKTALTQQFMTSEYLGGFDTSIGKAC